MLKTKLNFKLKNNTNNDDKNVLNENTENAFYVHKNKSLKKCLVFNRIFSVIITCLFLIFLLMFSINIAIFNLQGSNETIQKIKTFLIVFCSLGLFFNSLYLIAIFYSNWEKYHNYIFTFIFLSIFGSNIPNVFLNIVVYYLKTKKSNFKIKVKWKDIGFYHWKTIDIAMMGLFIGITILMTFLEENILPKLPSGGGIAVKYSILMIASIYLSVVSGFFVGLISAFLSILIVGGAAIISPWSFIFDYLLPMITPCIVGFFVKKNNFSSVICFLDYLNYIIPVVFVFIIIWIWQTISGTFIWNAIGWGLNNKFTYSLIYNGLHIWIFTYPITQIITIPIFKFIIQLKK